MHSFSYKTILKSPCLVNSFTFCDALIIENRFFFLYYSQRMAIHNDYPITIGECRRKTEIVVVVINTGW
jgi:hypothetical protein